MRPFLLRRAGPLAAAGLIALCLSTPADADTVLPGWDLFQTDATQTDVRWASTSAASRSGLRSPSPRPTPRGTRSFPPNPNLGPTDTIIERLGTRRPRPGDRARPIMAIQALQLDDHGGRAREYVRGGYPGRHITSPSTLSATAGAGPGRRTGP